MWDEEDVSFALLPPDIQVQVLHFLPLRSRVRMERVCKNWAAVLDYVWKRQKRLAICFANRYELDTCREPSHQFALSDIIVDSNHSFVHSQRESFSIVKRCPNLAALYFSANQVATPNFGSQLAHFCPKLEHVYLRDTTTFLAFAGYAASARSNHIRCLHIDNDDQDADDDFDDNLCEFVAKSPALESLSNFTNYNTITLLEAIAPKLVDLRMGTVDELAVPFLVAGSKRLERLAVKGSLDVDSVKLILTLVHIQHLEICATSCVLFLLAGSNVKLRSLTLLSAESEGFCADDLRLLLQQHGPNLTALEVAGLKLVNVDLTMFAEHCLLLQSLHILPSDPLTLTQASVQSLSRLTCLTSLEFCNFVMTHDQLDQLLNAMTKLKEISLINVQALPQLRDSVISFATRHPRRQIKLWCSYDDRPNASPPRRRSEGRMVRRPPGLSNIVVYANLRVIYSH